MISKFMQIRGDPGAGRTTLIGRLIYEYGGLGLPQLEQFEQKGAREYTQIAAFCEKENLMQHFYTASSQFIVDESKTPHTLVWIVDATVPDGGQASSQKLASLISTAYVQPRENLVVLVNKMDLLNWSPSAFGEIAHTFSTTGLIAKSKLSIIPFSVTQGANITETPREHPWVESIQPSPSFGNCQFVSSKPLMSLLG
ncbi:hypothetical protein F5Y04DRAFT_41953 [Hypomontagnella monticulosa]|nr:hypothetical protein F5Y04DRAFT_41953 [Hypomontagnella monticulosa]